jgi:hypothetical protein
LEIEVGRGRSCHALLKRFVESLMSPVFLRTAGVNALVGDAELEPPDVEAVETVNAAGGEGSAVVGADGLRKATGAKQMAQVGFHALPGDIAQTLAAEKITAEVVDDGEGVAVESIAHAELALEIDGPDLVRAGGAQRGGAGMLPVPPASAVVNVAVTSEDVADGTPGGPGALRVAGAQFPPVDEA